MSPGKKPTLPIAIYTRVSEQGDRSDESLRSHEIQRTKCEKYLDAHDLVASPDVFEDTDRSGGKMSRPAFNRALDGVRCGKYGGVAVYHLSRFGRNTVGVLQLVAEFEEMGASLVCLTPHIDTASPESRAMLTVFLAFYTLEREQAVVKAGDTAELKLAEGRSTGGRAPLGYEFEVLKQDEDGKNVLGWYIPSADAPVVTEAFEKYAAGELTTPGRVADFLNEHGLTTSHGNPWDNRNVRDFLMRETYTGYRIYNKRGAKGEVVSTWRSPEPTHEALVEPWMFRKVQAMVAPKGPTGPRVRGEGHVLGQGLLRCGCCGKGLTRGSANGAYQTLRCNARGGGHASIGYELAADYIVSLAFSHAGMTMQSDDGNLAEVEAADGRIALAKEALAEVEALRGSIAAASFALAHSDASRAVEAAEDARAALAVDPGTASLVFPLGNKEQFDALSIPEKRDALRGLISRVVVAPGKGHIGERLHVEFTDGTVWPAPDGTGAPVEVAPVAA
jgi:DNA invertase Pin-like site-specific DNA recombinase